MSGSISKRELPSFSSFIPGSTAYESLLKIRSAYSVLLVYRVLRGSSHPRKVGILGSRVWAPGSNNLKRAGIAANETVCLSDHHGAATHEKVHRLPDCAHIHACWVCPCAHVAWLQVQPSAGKPPQPAACAWELITQAPPPQHLHLPSSQHHAASQQAS